jgi:hypothetical protein
MQNDDSKKTLSWLQKLDQSLKKRAHKYGSDVVFDELMGILKVIFFLLMLSTLFVPIHWVFPVQ